MKINFGKFLNTNQGKRSFYRGISGKKNEMKVYVITSNHDKSPTGELVAICSSLGGAHQYIREWSERIAGKGHEYSWQEYHFLHYNPPLYHWMGVNYTYSLTRTPCYVHIIEREVDPPVK